MPGRVLGLINVIYYSLLHAHCSFKDYLASWYLSPRASSILELIFFPVWSFKILLLVIFHYHLLHFSFIWTIFIECLVSLVWEIKTVFCWGSLQRWPRLTGKRLTFTVLTIVCLFTCFSCKCGFSNHRKFSFFWIIDTLKYMTGYLESGSWINQ